MASARAVPLALALALLGAAPPAPLPPDPALVASLDALAAKDLRVATVAFRLQTAGAFWCRRTTGLPGMVVADPSQYRADLRPAAAALFNLRDAPAVTGVVPGGPAARAGLARGDQILMIDGAPPIAGRASRRRADGDAFTALSRRLADAFARGPVALTIRRDGETRTVTVAGARACPSAVQLDLGAARNAGADGRTVTVSQGLLDFLRSDDELAVVLGHELSHDILGHRQTIKATHTDTGLFAGVGRNGARLRETEREADTLGLFLDAWAGYDVAVAAPLYARFGKALWLVAAFGDGSHPGFADRERALAEEARQLGAEQAAGRRPLPPAGAFPAAAPGTIP